MNKLEEAIAKAIFDNMYSSNPADSYKSVAKAVMPFIENDATEFFVWLIRTAKIEVVDAQKAIEAHGFKDSNGFVPVYTINELYRKWLSENIGE